MPLDNPSGQSHCAGFELDTCRGFLIRNSCKGIIYFFIIPHLEFFERTPLNNPSEESHLAGFGQDS